MPTEPMPADTAAAIEVVNDVMGVSGLVHREDAVRMTAEQREAMLSRRPVAS